MPGVTLKPSPRLGFFLLAGWLIQLFAVSASAENWPQYRGPRGDCISQEKGIPTTWKEKEARWNIEIPGVGHSSPIVWGDRIFATTATEEGIHRHLLCLDVATGKTLWTRETSLNTHKKHTKNSYASASPATDGERVYTSFADLDHYAVDAYDMKGELVWHIDLGPFASQHGHGASPILFEDLLIVPNEQDGPSAIVALDRRTGKTVWTTPRTPREASYSTPLIFQPNPKEKPQLICVSGAHGISSLDPWSGKENWSTGAMAKRTVASPVAGDGLIYGLCGQGGKGHQLLGVDSHGKVKLDRDRELPYVPTVQPYQHRLYLWGDAGVVVCLKPETGEVVWKERAGGNISGSPICIDGRLFAMNEAGTVVVLATGDKFKLLGETSLGDPSHATPVVANGVLYLRTFHRLVAIPAKPSGT